MTKTSWEKRLKKFGKVLRENVENAVGGRNAHFDTWGYKTIMEAFSQELKKEREEILDEILKLAEYVEDNDGIDLTYLKAQIKSSYLNQKD